MATKASYNAVLKGLKKQGLSHTQAREAWKSLKDRLGHSPTARELKAHPRITSQEIKKVTKAPPKAPPKPPAKPPTKPPVKPPKKPPAKPPKRGPGKGRGGGGRPIVPPEIARELDAEWDDFEIEWEDDDPYGE